MARAVKYRPTEAAWKALRMDPGNQDNQGLPETPKTCVESLFGIPAISIRINKESLRVHKKISENQKAIFPYDSLFPFLESVP